MCGICGNESNTIQVVLNAEIYNYPALREDLLRKGHRLQTRSDTETIVHQYEEDGTNCLRRLDGMSAFALHDAANDGRNASCARPRREEAPPITLTSTVRRHVPGNEDDSGAVHDLQGRA